MFLDALERLATGGEKVPRPETAHAIVHRVTSLAFVNSVDEFTQSDDNVRPIAVTHLRLDVWWLIDDSQESNLFASLLHELADFESDNRAI